MFPGNRKRRVRDALINQEEIVARRVGHKVEPVLFRIGPAQERLVRESGNELLVLRFRNALPLHPAVGPPAESAIEP